MPARVFPAAALGGLAALIALRLWQGLDYWSYSEGVYALTSRLWADGADLYGSMAAAQPPGVFLVGAGLLSIDDSAEWLRLAMGVAGLAGGLLASAATWRLSENRWAAIAACPLVLLSPWAVHEHGTLTPEVVAVPLLLGAALLAADPRGRSLATFAAGALCAAAVAVKVPFLAPGLGILNYASDRLRAIATAVVAVAVILVLSVLVFDHFWRDVVTAQENSGRRSLGDMDGLVAQSAWSLAGLAIPALAVLIRRNTADPALARVWLGLTAGLAVTLVSLFKTGTALNVLVPLEAALIPLALTAVVRWPVALAGIVFVLAQTASLIAAPARTAVPFIYPTSERGAWGRKQTEAEIRAKARAARDCPPGVASPEEPLVAFVARRPPPGGQPDGFLIEASPTLARELRAVQADTARCP
jgi:hypothetical protein